MGTTTEKLTYLQGTKDAIKNAIVAKGVAVPEGTTFRGYAEKVGEISGTKTAIMNAQNFPIRDANGYFYYIDKNGELKKETNNISGREIEIVCPQIAVFYTEGFFNVNISGDISIVKQETINANYGIFIMIYLIEGNCEFKF